MQILLLEDSLQKRDAVIAHIAANHRGVVVTPVATLFEFFRAVNSTKFDLLLLDLVIPHRSVNEEPSDRTSEIVEYARDLDSKNFRTPGLVLTSYDEKAEENFRSLNQHDINVVNFTEGDDGWKPILDRKISLCAPRRRYAFVIVCALAKEVEGFSHAGFSLGPLHVVDGLECWTIGIAGKQGLVVRPPRMGLVDSAITSTLAISTFEPELICMSGICAGVKGAASIYDVVIAETCHQHDSGKWSGNQFQPEIYSVSIDHGLAQIFRARIESAGFLARMADGVKLLKGEKPSEARTLKFKVAMAPASSGSAVLAARKMIARIKAQQRKVAMVEMECYALYESARLSPLQPKYFSAKCVVDDGVNKGDEYHRVGCLLSAKVVADLVSAFPFSLPA